MSKLHLKLLRDLRSSPFMFAGIVLLLLVGIALFVASYSLYLNLEQSYATSYRRLRLADFTVPVQSAPAQVVTRLRRLPGVREVEGRTIREVEIRLPTQRGRKVTGRILSLPESGWPRVNSLKLAAGAAPGTGLQRELLLEAGFAEYHGYRPGDTLNLVVQDDPLGFRIVGIVQSPEYIFVVRGREAPYPSESTFAVVWIREGVVDELFGTAGAVNDIGVTMAPGGNRRSAVRLAERLLEPYGAETAVPQEEQPSVELLRLDLLGLQNLAIFFPLLFLTIASLSAYNTLGRMVHEQQGQIGFLRAVGFSKATVGLHYLLYAVAMGVLGGGLGAGLGYYLGILITRFYTTQIQVPYYDVSPRWIVLVVGFALAVVVAVAASLSPALSAARMTPAEAISTQGPTGGRAPLIESWLPVLRRLPLQDRLPLRNFLRNPRRSFATVAGVASAAMLLLVATGLLDSSVAAIEFYFKSSVHYDILATYLEPQPQFSLERLRRSPGVRRVEPLLAMPARLTKSDQQQTILVYGIEPDSRLFLLYDQRERPVAVPPDGLLIPESTARKLNLWEGALVRLGLPEQSVPATADFSPAVTPPVPFLPVPEAWQPRIRELLTAPGLASIKLDLDRLIRVSGVSYQPVGITAYASIDQLREWYRAPLELPPKAINALALTADAANLSAIEQRLHDLDGIASVSVISTIRREIDTALEQAQVFFNIMLAFSMALAGIIIFNATLMNVIERTREISTLRTLGLSVGAAVRMIWVENLLAYVVGLLVGVPVGTWLAGLFILAYESESFNMRLVIFPHTYVITVLSILATMALAQLPGTRFIRRLDLAKATKAMG